MGPFPHTVQVITPARVTDSRGNSNYVFEGPGVVSTTVNAWLQQDTSEETMVDGRDPLGRRWLLMAVAPSIPFTGRERVIWAAAPAGPLTFEVFGPGEPAYTLSGYHHTEVVLRRVDG